MTVRLPHLRRLCEGTSLSLVVLVLVFKSRSAQHSPGRQTWSPTWQVVKKKYLGVQLERFMHISVEEADLGFVLCEGTMHSEY